MGFINIEKLSLVPVPVPVLTHRVGENNRNKLSFTAAVMNKRSITPRQSLD